MLSSDDNTGQNLFFHGTVESLSLGILQTGGNLCECHLQSSYTILQGLTYSYRLGTGHDSVAVRIKGAQYLFPRLSSIGFLGNLVNGSVNRTIDKIPQLGRIGIAIDTIDVVDGGGLRTYGKGGVIPFQGCGSIG